MSISLNRAIPSKLGSGKIRLADRPTARNRENSGKSLLTNSAPREPASRRGPQLNRSDYRVIAMLRKGPLIHTHRGWRFGTNRIGDSVVSRLVVAGRAVLAGATLTLAENPATR